MNRMVRYAYRAIPTLHAYASHVITRVSGVWTKIHCYVGLQYKIQIDKYFFICKLMHKNVSTVYLYKKIVLC